MKLNPDCIRDVMLELQDGLVVEMQNYTIYRFVGVEAHTLADHMEKKFGYSREDTVYSALQLRESGYIATNGEGPAYGHMNMVEIGEIIYITPKGHEFISSVQDKETWSKKISPILKKMGGASLAVIEAVAKGFANAMLDKIDFSSLPASESP